MRALARDWRRYRGLPAPRRALLREAASELLRARLHLALVPFRRLAAQLGELGAESPGTLPEAAGPEVDAVGWAVAAMAARVPWDSLCLARALAAYRMLARRGLAATVYFGVRQEPGKALSAHAWLRCGDRLVSGGEGREDYRVICRFAPAGPR
ncbi:MAG: lasso peptide biosynthesis B2 protein [Holophagaceae bacterium]